MTTIRPARPSEAPVLSGLAIRSKSHWGYTDEQMAVFELELTLKPTQIRSHKAHVAENAGEIVGFYTLVPSRGSEVELEHLFVEPGMMGRGLGAALFTHACRVGLDNGYTALLIQSDPNAAGFYDALGARLVEEVPSSIPGRSIPVYRFTIVDR